MPLSGLISSNLEAAPNRKKGEVILKGVGVSPGIAIGPAYVYARTTFDAAPRKVKPEEVEEEINRFEQAIRRAEKELSKIARVARDKLGDESAQIFEAQKLMLRDEAIYPEVVQLIRSEHWQADYAVKRVMDIHRQRWEASSNELLLTRLSDLLDIEQRIIRILQQGRIISKIDPETIVVAKQLTAADVVLFSRRHILGFVTEFGGPTSHVSITARGLGMPAVVNAFGATASIETGDTIVLDAFTGKVVLRPRAATLEYYRKRQQMYEEMKEHQRELVKLPSETLDKRHIALRANLEFKEELPLLKEYGAEGIGLFRTEMQFLSEGKYLSEDEQFVLYQTILEEVNPYPVTFRLLDIGGDKVLPLAHREHNPFLGWRGIRILLDKPDILRPQVRAILRASVYGKTRLLLPMVTTLEEVLAFYDLFQEIQQELDVLGVPYDEEIPVGIMIEVPAAALMAHVLAEHVDFFSIGTNDLTQYVLAVDRGNDLVARLFDELHPSVLHLIKHTVEVAHQYGIPVSVCGEMASRPHAAPLLLGYGVDELSMSPAFLPEVKQVVRALTMHEARELAAKALEQPDAAAVTQLVNVWLKERLHELARFLEIDESIRTSDESTDE